MQHDIKRIKAQKNVCNLILKTKYFFIVMRLLFKQTFYEVVHL